MQLARVPELARVVHQPNVSFFAGLAVSGSWADSWIDLKGNGWVVENNHGTTALEDGFQVHQALSGWGNGNLFRNNLAEVDGPGYGFWLQNGITGRRSCAPTPCPVRGAGSRTSRAVPREPQSPSLGRQGRSASTKGSGSTSRALIS